MARGGIGGCGMLQERSIRINKYVFIYQLIVFLSQSDIWSYVSGLSLCFDGRKCLFDQALSK